MNVQSSGYFIRPKRLMLATLLTGWVIIIPSLFVSIQAEEVVFNRDVLPLLSKHCFACHGPDEAKREAALRLDTREGLFGDTGEGWVVQAGNPAKSLLIERIFSHDEDDVMPPPEAKMPLNDDQRALLQKWVEQGASWEGHWSFQTPELSTLPEVQQKSWVRNPIDRFILSELESQGLTPNSEADRATLIRRVAFDLTGLPPTPRELDAFLGDTDSAAYERMVDGFLNRHQFGERMALAWMDLARYGDSSVFHADGERFMWLWRDYVINAYNTNKPFDQFTMEQLAGDLMEGDDVWQKIASGFNRNHGTTDEGGAIAEEYRVEYIVDRVKTTSMVWLGLTMECGQCHKHKYDPITQKEYYQFYAFFNQAADPGMQTRNGNEAPLVRFFDSAQEQRHQALEQEIKALKKRHAEAKPSSELVKVWARGEQAKPLWAPPSLGAWKQLGPFEGSNTGELFAKDFGPETKLDLTAIIDGKSWSDPSYEDGKSIDLGLPGNSAVYLHRVITSEEAREVKLSLGSDDGIKCWLNGKVIHENNTSRGVAPDQDSAILALEKGENHFLMKIVNGGGGSGFYFRLVGDALPDSVRELLKLELASWSEEQFGEVSNYYQSTLWSEGLERAARISELEKEDAELLKTVPTSMIMGDLAEGRETFVLMRGHYASPIKDEVIHPGVPSFLPPMPDGAPSNRLGLAQWLVMPNHPLTSRVTVNRYWSMFFGRGIVETLEDFGTRGAWPSHPELLDWLARDFVDNGWNIKRTIKQILMSATYRQSATFGDTKLEMDPANVYLSRGPRRRLQGEFIRDNALMLAGVLDQQVGGKSVKPYQPPRIWNEVSLDGNLKYQRDEGSRLYRRSMYTFWKRSAPMPNMVAFDAPTREKCIIQRQVTNTPLQALVTMNDEQFVEASRLFAERILLEGGAAFEDRLHHAFRLALSKMASPVQLKALKAMHERQLKVYREDPDRAEALLAVGDHQRTASLDVAELATWTLIASAILNLDEVLTH